MGRASSFRGRERQPVPDPSLGFCRLRHCLEGRRLSPPRVTWSSLGVCPFVSEPLLCIKIIRKEPFSKYDHILGSCSLGLHIFVGSRIQPCALKPSVPGPPAPPPPSPVLEVSSARLGPGACPCPGQRLLSEASEAFFPRFCLHLSPGSPSSVLRLSLHTRSPRPYLRTAYGSKCGSPGSRDAVSPLLTRATWSETPLPLPPARVLTHLRLLGVPGSLTTPQPCPRGLSPVPRHRAPGTPRPRPVTGSATRFLRQIVLLWEGRLLFPSLSTLGSSRAPLIFTVNRFSKYSRLHWWSH